MADFLNAEQRSAHMARIRSKNTKPELVVRRLLHKLGSRYRIHFKGAPGRPDIAFPARKKLIHIHGCFWHAHQGCSGLRNPKSNSHYWSPKLARNRERDSEYLALAVDQGWGALTIWECEIGDAKVLEKRLRKFLGPQSTLE